MSTDIDDLVRDFGDGGQRAVILQRRLRELVELSRTRRQENEVPAAKENRRRFAALMAARTKLEAAAQLVSDASNDLIYSGLLPHENVQQIARAIATYIQRITSAIELIP